MIKFFKRIFSKREDHIDSYASNLSRAMTESIMASSKWNDMGYRIGHNLAAQSFEGMRNGQLVLETDLVEYLGSICADFEEKEAARNVFDFKIAELAAEGKIKILQVKHNQNFVKIWIHGEMPENDLHIQLQRFYGKVPEYTKI